MKRSLSGFTIVELLIVIVVIGILAAIAIVSYTGISQRAQNASLQSDLSNASTQLKLFQVDNSSFPATINCSIADSTTNKCVKYSNGNTYQYASNNSLNSQTFSLTATNNTQNYNIDQTGTMRPGGKNLLPDSQNMRTLANNTGLGTAVQMADEVIPYWRVTATSVVSTYEVPIYTLPLTVGTVYTISCEVRIIAPGSVGFFSNIGMNAGIPASAWTRISYTFTYSSAYRIGGNTYSGTQLDYRNWKVEAGSVSTGWTPAP